jgi:hypothetical protein
MQRCGQFFEFLGELCDKPCSFYLGSHPGATVDRLRLEGKHPSADGNFRFPQCGYSPLRLEAVLDVALPHSKNIYTPASRGVHRVRNERFSGHPF